MKKQHVLCKCTGRFRISERMQGLMCLFGQSMVFDQGEELFEKTLNIDISAKQIQRVSEYYGSALDPLIKANCEAVIPTLQSNQKDEVVYVMLDGSMVCTRGEQRWHEMKLGRVFYNSQTIDIQANRRSIMQSVFVSHFGSADEFLPKFERFLTPYKKKVILADGAKWIWNWAEDNYPGAVQIVDFYHAKEKLTEFARHQFPNTEKKQSWIKEQTAMLMDNKIDQVITKLRACRPRNEEAEEVRRRTVNYYTEHEDRMQYKTFRQKGLLIGSGPIEASHRSVIQQRLKLSGQKWSISGAQAIANLRCYKHSNAWNTILNVIGAAA